MRASSLMKSIFQSCGYSPTDPKLLAKKDITASSNIKKCGSHSIVQMVDRVRTELCKNEILIILPEGAEIVRADNEGKI